MAFQISADVEWMHCQFLSRQVGWSRLGKTPRHCGFADSALNPSMTTCIKPLRKCRRIRLYVCTYTTHSCGTEIQNVNKSPNLFSIKKSVPNIDIEHTLILFHCSKLLKQNTIIWQISIFFQMSFRILGKHLITRKINFAYHTHRNKCFRSQPNADPSGSAFGFFLCLAIERVNFVQLVLDTAVYVTKSIQEKY